MSAIHLTTARKALASLVLVGTAASIAGLGSFASFTGSTSASHTAASGTVTAALGAAGEVDNRLTVGASKIAAGDTIQRVVKLTNSGTINWLSAALTTSATTSSLLDTDATNGLKLVVDKCSTAWVEAGTAPAYTYTCPSTSVQTNVIASRAVIGSNLDLGSLAALTAGSADYLRVTMTLPTTADNTFQGKSSTIQFSFTGTQRNGTAA